jgi:hypothetical protein
MKALQDVGVMEEEKKEEGIGQLAALRDARW